MYPPELAHLEGLRPLTFDDLELIPDDLLRYEVLQGELITSKSPGTLHQQTHRKLFVLLDNAVQAVAIGEVISGPYAVELTRWDITLPDLIVIHRDQHQQLTERRFIGAPFLIMEIVTAESARFDYVRKAALYTRVRVPEYWVIDPERRQIIIHHQGGGSPTPQKFMAGSVSSTVLPGFHGEFDHLFPPRSMKGAQGNATSTDFQ
jgi:Uma2 family endonuclease